MENRTASSPQVYKEKIVKSSKHSTKLNIYIHGHVPPRPDLLCAAPYNRKTPQSYDHRFCSQTPT